MMQQQNHQDVALVLCWVTRIRRTKSEQGLLQLGRHKTLHAKTQVAQVSFLLALRKKITILLLAPFSIKIDEDVNDDDDNYCSSSSCNL